MKQQNEKQVKVTYATPEQRLILMLKESYQRDLVLFQNLLKGIPNNWTLTVIQKGSEKELVVNILPKKPDEKPSTGFFS